MSKTELIEKGMVWLVGAGPGDPDLLTRKAEKLILAATVIFHDALVGQGVLDLVPADTPDQRSINDLLVEAALAGEKVVRLKGGDPSIFGRATEEMEALCEHNIPYAICPGVTAASAAAASVEKSLTLRGLARKLTFVTAHVRSGGQLDLDWQALADPEATLSVYMGKSSAGLIAKKLLCAGLSKDTPVLLVESASLPQEKQFFTSLGLLELTAKTALGDGPALLLIGNAMGLKNPSNHSKKINAHIEL